MLKTKPVKPETFFILVVADLSQSLLIFVSLVQKHQLCCDRVVMLEHDQVLKLLLRCAVFPGPVRESGWSLFQTGVLI